MSSAQIEKLRREFPDHRTAGEVAGILGRSRNTIVRWRHSGTLVPSAHMQMGKIKVWLYSKADIEKGREVVATISPGRKKK